MWGKSSSILLPVFLKICNAASATFSSSIFKQARRDSKVSAEWNEIGCVNESTCQNMMKATLTFFKRPLILEHLIKSHFPLPYWNIYNILPVSDPWCTFLFFFFQQLLKFSVFIYDLISINLFPQSQFLLTMYFSVVTSTLASTGLQQEQVLTETQPMLRKQYLCCRSFTSEYF